MVALTIPTLDLSELEMHGSENEGQRINDIFIDRMQGSIDDLQQSETTYTAPASLEEAYLFVEACGFSCGVSCGSTVG